MMRILNTLLYVAGPIVVVIGAALFVQSAMKPIKQRAVMIDCALVEISPDFPPEVKQQCRKQRSKQ